MDGHTGGAAPDGSPRTAGRRGDRHDPGQAGEPGGVPAAAGPGTRLRNAFFLQRAACILIRRTIAADSNCIRQCSNSEPD
ncbi:MAG: hypothetical protein ACE5KM_14870 [Planctomycetaceae bacterium]